MSVCEYKDLANVFKHIKDIKGVKAFAEGSQVANIMTDLVPEMVVEISIINNLSQAGILSEFAQTSCSDRDGQKRTAFKAKNYLTVNIGTREDLIERCVSALAEAFGWNETPDETNLGVSDDLKFGGNTGAAIGTGNDGNSGKTETGAENREEKLLHRESLEPKADQKFFLENRPVYILMDMKLHKLAVR